MTKVCINYGYIATTIIILINFIWKIVIAKRKLGAYGNC
jgi:hypothetical protein